MNEKLEKYIKDLSPELQEKARQCKTKEELNAFITENNLELPEEALELVSGGCGTPLKCDRCGAVMDHLYNSFWKCPKCGYSKDDGVIY